jgi:hypothetical protein
VLRSRKRLSVPPTDNGRANPSLLSVNRAITVR